MNKKITLIILIASLGSTMLILSKSQFKTNAVTVRLKWYHNAQFAGIYSAIENGYYKENRLNLTLLERDLKKGQVSDEVASGKVDFGITNAIDLIKAVDEGKKIKAIAVIYQESPSAVVSLKESEILSPTDLAGKRLGIQQDTKEARIFYNSMLKKYDIDPKSVEFVTLENGVLEDLKNKNVDTSSIYRTNEIFEMKKAGIDFRIMRPEYYGFEYYDDVIITSDEMIKNHPEKVRTFIKSTMKGWKWTFENEKGALEIVSKYDHDKFDDRSREAFILESSKPLINWDNVSENIGRMEDKRWENIISDFYKLGIITKKIKPTDVFTKEFVNN